MSDIVIKMRTKMKAVSKNKTLDKPPRHLLLHRKQVPLLKNYFNFLWNEHYSIKAVETANPKKIPAIKIKRGKKTVRRSKNTRASFLGLK